MGRQRFRIGYCVTGLLCVLLSAPAWGQDANLQPAYLTVYVPAGAQLLIDGARTQQTGTLRRFVTPLLSTNKRYTYSLKATWQAGGKDVVHEREVNVQGGQESTVDLRDEVAVQPATKTQATGDRTPDVVYWPTPQNVVDKMLEMAKVKKSDLVYDLGCGDGRIVVTAAKKYGCKGVGIDIDPERIKDSMANVRQNKVEDLVTIKKADIFTMDFKDATVVTLYLLPDLNVRLMPQLAKLKPGTRIVSHDFDMKGAKPKEVVKIRAKNHMGIEGEHTIYLWVVPWEKE